MRLERFEKTQKDRGKKKREIDLRGRRGRRRTLPSVFLPSSLHTHTHTQAHTVH